MTLESADKEAGLLEATDAGRVRLAACCGGQGSSNLTGLDELAHLSRTYRDCFPVQHIIDSAARRLEGLAGIPHRSLFFYDRDFQLQSWLEDSASAPATDQLAVSPYSFPINTLLSLLHYALAAHALHLDPTQLRDRLDGVIGHSQGVFAAAAIAQAGSGWPDFYSAVDSALQLSFWVGLESHVAAPGSTLSAHEVADSLDHEEGQPSYLLSISGLDVNSLRHLIERLNNERNDDSLFSHLALVNTRSKCVIAGSPQALRRVCLALRTVKAPPTLDQTRVHFNRRRPVVDVQFLPISAPYHSPILEPVTTYVKNALTELRLTSDMAIPIYCTVDGKVKNLQTVEPDDIIETLVKAVTIEQVDWPIACRQLSRATHVLSLGPGPVGTLVQEVMDGTGVRVVHLSGRSLSSSLSSLATRGGFASVQPWCRRFRPRLREQNTEDRRTYVETKMTRLLGTPPVMVAGMTPTTCSTELVAAIMQAGYHVEFACGGYHRRTEMEAALRRLASLIPVHRSITCNVIYASPKSLTWQITLLRDLIDEGLPVEGLTIGAGIPSPEVVQEWIVSLGLAHIWFKPGSVDAIDRVLSIARQHPRFPIGLQWTGGRAGGHHSCEDVHQPIIERYSRIRECDNVVLIAGSGLGCAEDTWPYLIGSWSEALGLPAMPFDGVLLGSRMMVAREAKTSLPAKELIVGAAGIEDDGTAEWTRSEQREVGGVISVISEMGQPMHVLATRGMRLWHEFDRKFFSIRDTDRLRTELRQNRDDIINRLNRDYARPWFAMIDSGEAVEIEDMTYGQVLRRLSQLTYVQHLKRWIHASYCVLVHDFLYIAQARFGSGFQSSDDPTEMQIAFNAAYGAKVDEVLHPEDVAFLLALFRRPGQKPVPFIPRLDSQFETWFKKDSLWQSEDIDAVPDQDVQRICIIQGPVAARHSTACDEPAKLILDRICHRHLEILRQQGDDDDSLTCPNPDQRSPILPGVRISQDGSVRRYQLLGPALPSPEALAEHVVGDCAWARAALINPYVVLGQSHIRNPIRDAFQPEAADIVEVQIADGRVHEITLYHSGHDREIRAALELFQHDNAIISVALLDRVGKSITGTGLSLEFKCRVEGRCLCICSKEYLKRVRQLYTGLWSGDPKSGISASGMNSEFTGEQMAIENDNVRDFLAVVRQTGPAKCRDWDAQGRIVPLDYAVVIAWTALTKPVLLPDLDGDPLQLLHQSISIRRVSGARPLHVGDTVQTSSRITERTIDRTGQRVEVTAGIYRERQPVVQIRTVFVIQRRPQNVSGPQFRSVDEPEMTVHISSPLLLQVILSRKWLSLEEPHRDLLGKTIAFRLATQTGYDQSGAPNSLQVAGSVVLVPDHGSSNHSPGKTIGRVYLEDRGCRVNPVMDFLNRQGAPRQSRQSLQNPGWTGDSVISFAAPSSSELYASVSHDTNPIHTCPLFSRFAGRGQPVVHGMHLSATVRRIFEWMIGDTERSRFRKWTASFDGIVRTRDRLRMEVQHRAMEEGLMIVNVKVVNELTGDQVMHAEATIDQSQTVYVFTGQGTQEKGMGMGLYGTHKAAQAIWDRAERHFQAQYGLSLLHIVRDNPSTLTVHFGGRRGQQIRANYLAMAAGSEADKGMLPGLTASSRSYTFSYPAGLLMSTQFAQPALAVMEMAEYAHLQAQGVVQASSLFAGHSLGEYSALGACTTFMPFEALLSLILYRGLNMQNALPRDANGRTEYGMIAADPCRVRPDFGERNLMDLVRMISKETGLLLEVVNHNVRSRQYVCAGNIRTLFVLGQMCDEFGTSTALESTESWKRSIHHHMAQAQKITGQTQLTRGRATVPLAGVDIPFHSQMLRGHIDNYRQYLRRNLRISDLELSELVGRWVPNVVGKPFAVDVPYIRLVQEITGSQPLKDLLTKLGEI
ncbi:fatty acid synthase beta subunit [Aspergillus ustus]|uniref:Fatty acid synthase beta subunit n=1 Tax=Aspergillus ustus TaxID=40382 RepID=A0A0C1E6A0_ASPUT|nr:fatty acid synthase beta subunit [Aspergillus ustus]